MFSVCLTTKPVGEPDAGNPHVRFDERGWETERCRMALATAPILDSAFSVIPACPLFGRYRGENGPLPNGTDRRLQACQVGIHHQNAGSSLGYPLYTTMSNITSFESGSNSGGGSISFVSNNCFLPALFRNGS